MDVNKMIASILKQLCCIWEIINSQASAIVFGTSFSGAGTEADPKQISVWAEGDGYGGGDGTEANPLIINGGGGGGTPPLDQVIAVGNTVPANTPIDFLGGSPTSGSAGTIRGGDATQNTLFIEAAAGKSLRLTGPNGIRTISQLTFEGTQTSVIFQPVAGENGNAISFRNTTGTQLATIGRANNALVLDSNAGASIITLNGQVGTLPSVTPGPIVPTDKWLEALVKAGSGAPAEGTWTPAGSDPIWSVDAANSTCRYVQVGNQITTTCKITINANSSGPGGSGFTLTGLYIPTGKTVVSNFAATWRTAGGGGNEFNNMEVSSPGGTGTLRLISPLFGAGTPGTPIVVECSFSYLVQ